MTGSSLLPANSSQEVNRVMIHSRRAFVATASTAIGLAPLGAVARATPSSSDGDLAELANRIRELFRPLPGKNAFKIWAPATDDKPEFLVEQNASDRLFVGSAIKAFVLCERLRQLDSPTVVTTLRETELALDSRVWSPDSQIFNPPKLSGMVSERTALEAMILHSDNTATDMAFLQAGPDKVRAFIESIGLDASSVPDSTRSFFGYLLGVPDYRNFTWEQLTALPDTAPFVNPPLNDVSTLASSADDFVSFYALSLLGEFFESAETLDEYRRILSLGDVVSFVMPLDVGGFAKGGSIDVPGFHALCVAGAMFFENRWVYLTTIINWDAPGTTDPETVSAYLVVVKEALALTKEGVS